jgi:nucleotide-binding universal stress UspA family protein
MSTHINQQRDTVLVALDGSLAAATAVPIAFAVAAQIGAACRGLHIISSNDPGSQLVAPWMKGMKSLTGLGLWPDMLKPTVQLWRAFAAPGNALMKEFFHAEMCLDVGDPAMGILRASADPEVALVVLTTHGHVIEPGRRLGRVAEHVIAGTTRPILLIRPEATPLATRPGGALRGLLLPLDGTPTTAALLAPATKLAHRLSAAVDLLYVAGVGAPPGEPGSIVGPQYVDQPQHEWPEWANEVITRLGAACAQLSPNVLVRMFLAQGDVGATIARFAAEHRSDAVVLARRSRLEPGRASVLRAVLEQTPCPILLVGD